MLNMAGIEATFVITRNDERTVCISARSRNKINVQRIMEEMGGGGHFNLAACQLKGTSVRRSPQTLIRKDQRRIYRKRGSLR